MHHEQVCRRSCFWPGAPAFNRDQHSLLSGVPHIFKAHLTILQPRDQGRGWEGRRRGSHHAIDVAHIQALHAHRDVLPLRSHPPLSPRVKVRTYLGLHHLCRDQHLHFIRK